MNFLPYLGSWFCMHLHRPDRPQLFCSSGESILQYFFVAAIIIFLIGYYAVLNPIVNQKKQLFSDKELKQTEIQTMNSEISTMKKAIKNKTPEFKESSKLFHTKAEVEGLYDSLSKFAGVNGLIISKIEKGNPKPVLKQGVANTQTTESLDVNNIRYYKIFGRGWGMGDGGGSQRVRSRARPWPRHPVTAVLRCACRHMPARWPRLLTWAAARRRPQTSRSASWSRTCSST